MNDIMKQSEFDDQGNKNPSGQPGGKSENVHEEVIPVIEESVQVGKKWVETAKVHITKKVSEHKELIDIPLKHEEVNIERVEVNEFVDSLPPAVRYEGETMIIPVLKEVVVKRVMIVEEIRITRKEVHSHTREEINVKKEEIHVNKTNLSDQDQLK
jgi:uncharacterized protein (TIGR02271 family)